MSILISDAELAAMDPAPVVRAPRALRAHDDVRAAPRGTLRNVIDQCEGSLGWNPNCRDENRRWVMSAATKRLQAAMAQNPRLFTLRNLELAVAYCYRKRQHVADPVQLLWHVERALSEAAAPVVVKPVEERQAEAIRFEKALMDEQSERWLTRLDRASGVGLLDVLDQWQHRRGR